MTGRMNVALTERQCAVCEKTFMHDCLADWHKISAFCEPLPSNPASLGNHTLRVTNGMGETVVVCPECMIDVLENALKCVRENPWWEKPSEQQIEETR